MFGDQRSSTRRPQGFNHRSCSTSDRAFPAPERNRALRRLLINGLLDDLQLQPRMGCLLKTSEDWGWRAACPLGWPFVEQHLSLLSDVGIAVDEPMVVLSTRNEPTGSGDNVGVLNRLRTFFCKRSQAMTLPSMFHMHLVSDATGETLVAIAKAATVQYQNIRAIEHVHPLVRTQRQLKRVLADIEKEPGIVLYTVVNKALVGELEQHCQRLKIPCLAVLQPIMQVFESYLGAPQTPTVAGQHVLDADYFRRIDAMNFTMAHDDGRLPDNLSDADIILLGISRTSKTPTSLYLAQRGYKTTNLPLVPQVPLPENCFDRTQHLSSA